MTSKRDNSGWVAPASAAMLIVAILGDGPPAVAEVPVGTAITYQGELQQGSNPVDDMCEFEFSLWNDPASTDPADQVGSTLMQTVDVVAGRFTSTLDFGTGIFTGSARWLEIAVCCPASCMDYTTLSPRQELTPAPQALALPSLYTSPGTSPIYDAPNVIGGHSDNSVADEVSGATIAGGGQQGGPNVVADNWGVVSGGQGNTASGLSSAVGGGFFNTASGWNATVGGGRENISSEFVATVGGGEANIASGDRATVAGGQSNTSSAFAATVGGGAFNTASDLGATVGGGAFNTASADRATVAGGAFNTASGGFSTVPGGSFNQAGGVVSFAAGHRAIVRDASQSGNEEGDKGTFIWADSLGVDFMSSGQDQFLIRAAGGVGIGKNNPTEQLDVAGNMRADGTITSGESITIDGTAGAEKIISSDALELHTSAGRGWRLEPGTHPSTNSPNIIGGHEDNSVGADVSGATISGGGAGSIIDRNFVDGRFGTIGGGSGNWTSGIGSTVGGGLFNQASVGSSTVGGGFFNEASGEDPTVGGGSFNTASGFNGPTVGGGNENTASGGGSTVGGGIGNTASGDVSTVPGGVLNVADGTASFAAGRQAKANHAGAFVWGDNTFEDFASTGVNQFLVRASGGVGIGTTAPTADLHLSGGPGSVKLLLEADTDNIGENNQPRLTLSQDGGAVLGELGFFDSTNDLTLSTTAMVSSDIVLLPRDNVGIGTASPGHPLEMASGAHVTAGGTWTNVSSRHLKEDITPVEPADVLARVANLPISSWNYKNEDDAIRHIGPFAEDFYAAFGLGGDDTSIGTIDADGVALAAIQGLYEMVKEKDAEIAALRSEMEDRIAALEKKLVELTANGQR